MRAQFVLQEIWIGLRRNLTMTISLVITVAIAMALFGTGLLIQLQVSNSKSYWHDRIEVSVFLCAKTSPNPNCNKADATAEQRQQIQSDLDRLSAVKEVKYESKEQAYQRFKESFSTNPGFVQTTKVGDIPDSFRVRLKDPEKYEDVTKLLANRAGVDQVVNHKDILDRFFKILNGLQWAAMLIAVIQVVAAVLLVANTVRLSAFNRRRETGIMRLVGASNLYIQLPFILEGAIAGLIGGVFAAVLLVASKIALIDRLQESLQITAQLSWASVVGVIIFSICVGVLLCAAASFLSLRRYLRV
ncbi:MAG TPA: permease-like cell division protein FtsX [Thermomonospora sp.]|nr:permease-like cell division protein FtsX [Thermomonospora sp.]